MQTIQTSPEESVVPAECPVNAGFYGGILCGMFVFSNFLKTILVNCGINANCEMYLEEVLHSSCSPCDSLSANWAKRGVQTQPEICRCQGDVSKKTHSLASLTDEVTPVTTLEDLSGRRHLFIAHLHKQ